MQNYINPKRKNAIHQSNNFYCSRSKSQIQKKIIDIKSEIIQANNVAQNIIGLKNLGNTCYFNSSLQCVLNCRFFLLYFSYSTNLSLSLFIFLLFCPLVATISTFLSVCFLYY